MTHAEMERKTQQGRQLAEVLGLRPLGGVRGTNYGAEYQTTWGKKSALGITETVLALLAQQEG